MVSSLVCSQLVLSALVWVFLTLYGLCPSEPTATRPTPPASGTPPRKRSCDPNLLSARPASPPATPVKGVAQRFVFMPHAA
jgi:hypothetical protein